MQSHDIVAHPALATAVWVRSALAVARHRIRDDERGEGVISVAIVVLIMAGLGALMWVAFKGIFQSASDNTSRQVDSIGG